MAASRLGTVQDQVTVRHETSPDGIDVVALGGDLDYATAPRLGKQLEPVLAGGRGLVVLDLTGLTFLDSSGLVAIIDAAKLVERRGGRLVVVAHDPRIARVFELTGLDRALGLLATTAEAIAVLEAPLPARPRLT